MFDGCELRKVLVKYRSIAARQWFYSLRGTDVSRSGDSFKLQCAQHGRAAAARWAHNPEVTGSIPVRAISTPLQRSPFFGRSFFAPYLSKNTFRLNIDSISTDIYNG